VALSLPYVADLMAFVGALLTMSISLIIPALMHLRLLGHTLGPLGQALDGGVLLLGVSCAVVGASSAWINIRQKMAAAAAAAAAAAGGGAC
jgi:amino acid permease